MPLAQTSRSGPPSSAAAPSPRQSSNAKVSSLSVWACETTASSATWYCWSLKIVDGNTKEAKAYDSPHQQRTSAYVRNPMEERLGEMATRERKSERHGNRERKIEAGKQPRSSPAKTSARAAWRASRRASSSSRPGPPPASTPPGTLGGTAWSSRPGGPAGRRMGPWLCNPPGACMYVFCFCLVCSSV